MEANKKFVQKINARIKSIRNWMSKNNLDQDYFNVSVLSDVFKFNGVVKTKSYYLSTTSVFDDKTMKEIEKKIGTKTSMIPELQQYVLDAYEGEENKPDVKNMSVNELFKVAGIIANLYASYEEALEEYYNYHPKDTMFDYSNYDDEIKEVLSALLMKIQNDIHHPGIWALPVSTVEANKQLIGSFTALIDAIKSQDSNAISRTVKDIKSSINSGVLDNALQESEQALAREYRILKEQY